MTQITKLRLPFALLAACAALVALPAAASAVQVVPNEIVVQYVDPATGQAPSPAAADPVVIKVDNVNRALATLRSRDDVAYAVPNLIAHIAATGYTPNDPLLASLQWNFVGAYGVRAQQAWANAIAAGRAGGRGTIIAVIDTGVAYSNRVPYRISPDFTAGQFVRGWDFVDGDPYANDANGHGTHVAGTIAEKTNNRISLAGLAYGAKIMPIRVLNRDGEGNANDIADAVRFAVNRGVKLVNLSLQFDPEATAADMPQLLAAISYARSKRVMVVAASGNEGASKVSYPARAGGVTSVGATTENGCASEFSNSGWGLDIVAPGGGTDSARTDEARCRPSDASLRNIAQVTFRSSSFSIFGIPRDFQGTSMAVPHVTAAAALVIASGVIGSNPSPAQLEARLKRTARDLGSAGTDRNYGAGLLDAAAASAR